METMMKHFLVVKMQYLVFEQFVMRKNWESDCMRLINESVRSRKTYMLRSYANLKGRVKKIIQTASLRALSVKNSMNTETTLIVLNV